MIIPYNSWKDLKLKVRYPNCTCTLDKWINMYIAGEVGHAFRYTIFWKNSPGSKSSHQIIPPQKHKTSNVDLFAGPTVGFGSLSGGTNLQCFIGMKKIWTLKNPQLFISNFWKNLGLENLGLKKSSCFVLFVRPGTRLVKILRPGVLAAAVPVADGTVDYAHMSVVHVLRWFWELRMFAEAIWCN